MAVFNPEIKEVTDDEQLTGIIPDLMEEIEEQGLAMGRVGQIRTQMGVGNKIENFPLFFAVIYHCESSGVDLF